MTMDSAHLLETPIIKTPSEWAAHRFPEVLKVCPFPFLESRVQHGLLSKIVVESISEDFFALGLGHLGQGLNPIVYLEAENQFYQYEEDRGLYQKVSPGQIKLQIRLLLDQCLATTTNDVLPSSLLKFKSAEHIDPILERMRELLRVGPDYFHAGFFPYLGLQNGVLHVPTRALHLASATRPFRSVLAFDYERGARPEMFLNLLNSSLGPGDVEALQLYFSQLLLGKNYAQKILLMKGKAGWGKGLLMSVIQGLFGSSLFGVLRSQLFNSGPELSRYRGKQILYHPDMPTDFLKDPRAAIFKQLVGGDLMWADEPGTREPLSFNGDFLCVLSCNGSPHIHLDEDHGAWERRLLIVDFDEPKAGSRIGRAADIVQHEGPGILNWLLEGREKLYRQKLQIELNGEQRQRVNDLLFASDSPRAFVRSRLRPKTGGALGCGYLYQQYRLFCEGRGIRAVDRRQFMAMVQEEIRELHGLGCRHDLMGQEGKAQRGWVGLMIDVESSSGED